MRRKIITFLKKHPSLLGFLWSVGRLFFGVLCLFVRVKDKRIIFSSFGGRKFDDSPKALYDRILETPFFDDYELIWAFEDPASFDIPRGKKVRIDTIRFFLALFSSKIWIDNSGIDRGLGVKKKKTIHIQTWHGAPLKKICGEENSGSISKKKPKREKNAFYCSQSSFDRTIFARVFNCDLNDVLESDLPRNDRLATKPDRSEIEQIKTRLGIPVTKKVIFYMPTYREYLVTKENETFIKPPILLSKWKERLGAEYVLLVRAHYAVTKSMEIKEDDFVKDVSNYPSINDLYLVSDILISDYSSAFFDYAILQRPMLCFAYDLDEYSCKRGLYSKLEDILPCPICHTEDEIIDNIENMDYNRSCESTRIFSQKFAPHAGHACEVVIEKLLSLLQKK